MITIEILHDEHETETLPLPKRHPAHSIRWTWQPILFQAIQAAWLIGIKHNDELADRTGTYNHPAHNWLDENLQTEPKRWG